MALLKEEYKMQGDTAPEGTTVIPCSICNTKYAVPTAEAEEFKGQVAVCQGCSDTYEKAAADLKSVPLNTATTTLEKVGDMSSPADKAAQL